MRTFMMALTLLSFLASPSAGLTQDRYEIALSGMVLEEAEALTLVNEGKYKMTQIRESDGSLVSLLYREASDLSGHMPPHVVEAMARMDAGIDPGAHFLGKPMPAFSLKDLDGNPLDSADLKGDVVVLNYWFIACLPCIREMPMLTRLETRYKDKDDVHFIAMSFDDPFAIQTMLAQREFSYRQFSAPASWFPENGIDTYPTHLVVGRDGMVKGALVGLEDVNSLEKELQALIDQALKER